MIVSPDQYASLHTAKGVQLYQFPPSEQIEMTWKRALRETSTCDLTAPVGDHADHLMIEPWLHHLSVYDAEDNLLWTGPVTKAAASRTTLSIAAFDASAYYKRTRTPVTKRWDAADPAVIAGELWRAMIRHHGLSADPLVRPDPEGSRYDFAAVADTTMLDQTMSDLQSRGLKWSVVAGVPILGPVGRRAMADLGEADFLGEGVTITRDGSQTFNDILLRGADNLARAHVPAGGLSLQTLVTIDSMFGVGNCDRAARDYARYVAGVRDAITLPSGSLLHPDAPLTVDMLVPSARFNVSARGMRVMMELTRIEVTSKNGEASVAVSMESVLPDLPELMTAGTVGGTQ